MCKVLPPNNKNSITKVKLGANKRSFARLNLHRLLEGGLRLR